ncbi:cell division protein FtsQ/DivIB [Secundilactobacillus malefermentans]|uniref:Cell division protein DivIB n=1 Tax=Secundilactobacillus malefermentans TaxID=176292 RepID=A0A4R5NTT2_9LACO|nr:cell division protein FtsQ/DivIB [Secundilactobacillus malefermentans]KRM58531.1 cell division protein FtsQ [Secundilactobacillus malefermentans DSM 5705 = KCTC 3548]QEA30882.1 FtsQ-type POTRA domain-containing protein [Secundilactobacillus malefermentans]TDG80662.1 hypothetical protein C5L31_001238 [Secundilactobacillus malefermentans]
MGKKSDEELTPWQRYQEAQKKRERAQSSLFTKLRPKRIGKKLSKLRKQQNQKLILKMGSLVLAFGLALLFVIYLISPLSHIQKININGNRSLSNQEVLTSMNLAKGDSVFSVLGRQKEIQSTARGANVKVKSVKVSLSHLNRVTVKIAEYKTAAFLVKKQRYYVILESGVISHHGKKQPMAHYPIFSHFKTVKTTQKMVQQYNHLNKTVQQNISEVRFSPSKSNPDRVHLFMNDGNEVYATLTTLAKKMAFYESISSKMKQNGVINLEVGAYSYPFK